MNIGITGQSGFIGWHLFQFLKFTTGANIIPFDKEYFKDQKTLINFIKKCDVVVHLAAMNRSPDLDILYQTNIELVNKLLSACEVYKPKIYFTSSTQEVKDNPYGRSKKEGWSLIKAWGHKNKATVGAFIVPNVFGPFGKPNYNSFVATFCQKIANNEEAAIVKDAQVSLIHVHDLVKEIWRNICEGQSGKININPIYKLKVSTVLNNLKHFKKSYIDQGSIPNLNDRFLLQLFNMFITYIPYYYYPVLYTKHSDNRGSFVEIVRANTSGQFSFSITVPGVTRGNHFHTRKAERFAVIKGKAKIELRKIGTDKVISYELAGSRPAYVDMPIWHTHNITNIGEEDLITLFWINEPYDPDNSDTYLIDV